MMKDIQNQKEFRGIRLNEVGIKHIKLPVRILDKGKKVQHTIAEFHLVVSLDKNKRGTHMSRFVEILDEYIKKDLNLKVLGEIVSEMKKRLEAIDSKIIMKFPYFKRKMSPISRKESILNYECCFTCTGKNFEDKIIEVNVPITTLCPCSKEISRFGAHNQRGFARVRIISSKNIWIEDIINLVEKEASCEIFPLLKRVDEKYVTEKAYMNPKFVEDVVRDVVKKLKKNKSIISYEIGLLNNESIHLHDAYASVSGEVK